MVIFPRGQDIESLRDKFLRVRIEDPLEEKKIIHLEFISKISRMKERSMIIFPKGDYKYLKRKSVRVIIEEIPVRREDETK